MIKLSGEVYDLDPEDWQELRGYLTPDAEKVYLELRRIRAAGVEQDDEENFYRRLGMNSNRLGKALNKLHTIGFITVEK